ncbi:MAG: formate dehydrogenase accessory sulfurtransferase FdhD [Deltaproteobacteria bacterium]|nr:formate dehydrogenase accessory sulfurtransferase FdhD [Deltaproteobacteria bacterium]
MREGELKTLKKYPALLIQDGRAQEVEDWVVAEDSYELYLNDTLVDTMVVSFSDLEAHAMGYVVTEGLVKPEEVKDVQQKGHQVFVSTVGRKKVNPSKTLWRSSAYRGSEGASIPVVSSSAKITPALIVQCAKQISAQAENWRKTGGIHISLLFNQQGGVIKVVEDIGRHNSVDKVVGYALLHHIPLTETILVCSGRQPEGMILKAARARIPIVVTKAAVTDRGIETAERLGVTLIGFARKGRFTIYSHPERVST